MKQNEQPEHISFTKLAVNVAKSTQTAIPELGRKETTIYYLVIGEGENKTIINVGQKTHDKVMELITTQKNTK